MYLLALNNTFRGLIISCVAESKILLWDVFIKCGFDKRQLWKHSLAFQVVFFFKLVCPPNGNCNTIPQMQDLQGLSVHIFRLLQTLCTVALRSQWIFETSSPLPHCPSLPQAVSTMQDTKWGDPRGQERKLWVVSKEKTDLRECR